MVKKLYAQFGHPEESKLLKIIKRAGLDEDKRLLQEVDSVSSNCNVCKEFRKPSPTPIMGLPHAESFNDTVALDLKFHEGHIILHVIDHLTRYSSATVCISKEPKTIVKGFIKCWISIFGAPRKVMVDNGGEFANQIFMEMAESFNIRILTTAAYSPWSNGLVERHNATLAEILYKVQADGVSDIETALCWTLQAKNALDNVHGFSPAQLVFGQNPSIPTTLNSQLPALESDYSAELVTENMRTLKVAREAFIKAESSERIKRALRHNIRPSGANRFYTGDLVFYKRNDSRRWRGPGRVIGSESSNVLIKHGSSYVRVHACRVMLDDKRNENMEQRPQAQTSGSEPTESEHAKRNPQPNEESSSDEESTEEFEDALVGQDSNEEDEEVSRSKNEEDEDSNVVLGQEREMVLISHIKKP